MGFLSKPLKTNHLFNLARRKKTLAIWNKSPLPPPLYPNYQNAKENMGKKSRWQTGHWSGTLKEQTAHRKKLDELRNVVKGWAAVSV